MFCSHSKRSSCTAHSCFQFNCLYVVGSTCRKKDEEKNSQDKFLKIFTGKRIKKLKTVTQ